MGLSELGRDFQTELLGQVERLREALGFTGTLELGYHFDLEIVPDWNAILRRAEVRAKTLGYSEEVTALRLVPKFDRLRVKGSRLNHLEEGGFSAQIDYVPFVAVGGKAMALAHSGTVFDLRELRFNFGLGYGAEIQKPSPIPGLGQVAECFRNAEKELAVYFECDDFESFAVMSLGWDRKEEREKAEMPNERLALGAPVDLDGILNRTYMAAIDREPFSYPGVADDQPDRAVEAMPDVAPGLKVTLQSTYVEVGEVWVAGSPSGGWLSLDGEFFSIRVRIVPLRI